ncbi:MAG: RsmG family class I SAM-dependent methyltransferase [Ilumatobacter sp.]
MIDPDVRAALVESQRLGFLGERPIDEVVEHARAFGSAVADVSGCVADLGSGGGVPGLVLAHDRPDLAMLLVDRRAKRTDFLARVVRRLGWTDRVTVVCADVADVISSGEFVVDAAVARGFGPPMVTLTLGARLVRSGGKIVISEPPSGDRWVSEMYAELGVRRTDVTGGQVSIFERSAV